MKKEKLKSCPFCGGEMWFLPDKDLPKMGLRVIAGMRAIYGEHSDGCPIGETTQGRVLWLSHQAIAAWNRRDEG